MAIYPQAAWLGPSPNESGDLTDPKIGVLHIMEGSLGGTDSWFNNQAAQVSAHFGVGKNGVVHQYVDTGRVAWAEASFNGEAISVECEGVSGDPFTLAQAFAVMNLMKWINNVHGVPLAHSSQFGYGWVGHGELGVSGGNHPNCPGAVMLSQLPTIFAHAVGNALPAPVAPPAPATLPVLGFGSQNWLNICWVQSKLKVPVTGVYDAATINAVRAFQTFVNALGHQPPLGEDGIVGAATWTAMGA